MRLKCYSPLGNMAPPFDKPAGYFLLLSAGNLHRAKYHSPPRPMGTVGIVGNRYGALPADGFLSPRDLLGEVCPVILA